MPSFSEKSTAEDPLIEKLKERGWTYVPGEELDRESFDEPLLLKNFVRKIREINKDIKLEDVDINNVVNELKLRGSGIEGCRQILGFLRKGVPVKLEKDRSLVRVRLFDYERTENNEFIISSQVVFHGKQVIRPDIILFINGIPLVDIECKNPASFSEGWFDAYRQVKDYEQIVPELYKYVQLGVAVEQTVKYFPIVPWQEEVKSHEWKEKGVLDPLDAVMGLFTPVTLLDVVCNYLFHRMEKGEETKVVTRYMQYRASEQIVKRVINNLEGKETKDKGLIWHWQGSGKTLTMIFAANKLYQDPRLENPSVFFIVDRLELEEQLYREYNALDIVEPEIIGSIDELRKILEFDEFRGKRGVFITLIHKFRIEELLGLQKELEEKSETQETVLSRKNVLAFLDEGHRTQYGMLAAQMKGILKNAFFFAFTGTPVAKTGKDTYREFAYPPEEMYLDKYFVTESLRDEFTVKISYQPRLEKDVHLKKDLLELFLKIEAEEIPEKARSVVEEKVKRKLNPINLFLEDPDRIRKVAADIAQHYTENVDGRFKAMVVAASRKACVYYKRALDKLLPKEYSEVVMTYNRDDDKEIREYHKELTERFKGLEDDKIKKDIVEKYNEEENPRILIVTDMLLTGFDAPILQTMYLDKPLKEHRLLQAIARTNRPYKDVKEAGKIIDYVGILDQINKAFANYSKEDYENALFSIDDIKAEFSELIKEMLSVFKDVEKRKYDRMTLLKAVEVLTSDEENGREFLENYKHLRKIFELLGSDISKLDYFEDYKWLSSVYTYYMRVVLRETGSYEGYVQKYFAKTVRVVHEATEIYNLEKELPVVDFDERYLLRLEEEAMNTEEKAANIVFTLNRLVLVEKNKNPIYESVAEKVERIVDLWKEKTKDFEKIYKEGAEVLNQIDQLTERQKRLKFNELEYAILLVLEKRAGENKDLVNEVKELSELLQKDMFTGWLTQSTARKNAERDIRRFVRRFVKEHELDINQIDEIYLELMEKLKNYEQ